MTATWSFINSPELNGKVAVITGANSGLGFETGRPVVDEGDDPFGAVLRRPIRDCGG